jgi:CheY-like chemotaxis protein
MGSINNTGGNNNTDNQNPSGINILLIEDNESDQFLFKEIALQASPESTVTIADNGHDALEILEKDGLMPQIMFLDINMPQMNGYEFLKVYGDHIQEKKIPVYVLTSSTYERDRVRFSPFDFIEGFYIKSAGYDNIAEIILQYIDNPSLVTSH